MSQYSFTKSDVQKPYALIDALQNTGLYAWLTYESPALVVGTTHELTNEELASLTSVIDNYTDPEIFLMLSSTIPDTLRSITTNSPTPEVVQGFIYSNTFNDIGTFNAIKSVLEYQTNDVQNFIDFSGSCFVTYEIKCYTRNLVICSYQLDITDVCESWKTMAENNETGPKLVYKTFMVEGLRNLVADYDCIWNYIISVSNPNVNVTIHAKQMLYYNILT